MNRARDSYPWSCRLSFNCPPPPPGDSVCICRLDDSGIVCSSWFASRTFSCFKVVAISCAGCGVQSALGESAAHCDRLSAEACVRELIQCHACCLAGACSQDEMSHLRRRLAAVLTKEEGVLHQRAGTCEGVKPYRPCVSNKWVLCGPDSR